jgi:hypothetical protein
MRWLVSALAIALSVATPGPFTVGALGIGVGGSVSLTTIDMRGTYAGVPVGIQEGLVPLGLKLLLDTKYLQGSIGYSLTKNGSLAVTVGGSHATGSIEGTLEYLDFVAFLRFPFNIQNNEVFPLLGVEYKYNIADLDGAGQDLTPLLSPQQKADLSELWFEAGVGADFFFGDFYIRPEITLGFKLLSPTDQSAVTAMQSVGYVSPSMSYFSVNLDVFFGWILVNEKLSNMR